MATRRKKKSELPPEPVPAKASGAPGLTWLKAAYRFHTFAYRDPRAAFSSAVGQPVVSPTTVLLGIASTLFCLGMADEARTFLDDMYACKVVVNPPDGMIFFRAFHQLRRYFSTQKGRTERAGLTNINQGTREYALLEGKLVLYVGVPQIHAEAVRLALRNRDHLGTHDSLCSLVNDVRDCNEPTDVVYLPLGQAPMVIPDVSPVIVVTLSRFKEATQPTVGRHWWMAGGENTELVPYLIKGSFRGTTRGKIYSKR